MSRGRRRRRLRSRSSSTSVSPRGQRTRGGGSVGCVRHEENTSGGGTTAAMREREGEGKEEEGWVSAGEDGCVFYILFFSLFFLRLDSGKDRERQRETWRKRWEKKMGKKGWKRRGKEEEEDQKLLMILLSFEHGFSDSALSNPQYSSYFSLSCFSVYFQTTKTHYSDFTISGVVFFRFSLKLRENEYICCEQRSDVNRDLLQR